MLPIALEIPMDSIILTSGRTHNRIRSPRLAASGRESKVDEGSRQNRSVTSGKGMALRVGHWDPTLGALSVREPPDAFWWIGDPSVGGGSG